MKKIETSEKREISRGKIHANPYNPKKHSDDAVKMQARNIRENGYLGGIVWNERTGNLIDGHRRLMALDLINKYDGTNDYTLMVEVVDFDEKTELEQLTYMAAGNTKADFGAISKYFDNISDKWFTGDDLGYIEELRDSTEQGDMKDLTDLFVKKREENKERTITKEDKKRKMQAAANRMDEKQFDLRRHVLIRLKDDDELIEFCEAIGVRPEYDLIIDAKTILEMIN
ncbi:MAG: ParB/RepB/Spo0J family partition protein [Bacteroidales bacterium]|nr:ParB/RepB/Spo0J family partition protein [Bacteroidales bacterium]